MISVNNCPNLVNLFIDLRYFLHQNIFNILVRIQFLVLILYII